jgi:phospholipid/cholesterol/gamma-HCH transport system substrate-binding protein
MSRNPFETVLGAVVLVVAVMFLIFAYSTANVRSMAGGYQVSADFLKVGGLTRGSDVRMSGITIGTVSAQDLDPKTFTAHVVLTIQDAVRLPTDTEASITSDGLMGGKYVNLVPGHAADRIPPGGKIIHAQDYQSLEDLVGQIIFLATQEPTKDNGGDASPPPATNPLPKDTPK